MSKFQKALDRLLARPTDFTWQELKTVLGKLGYAELRGKGSRRKFIHQMTKHIVKSARTPPATSIEDLCDRLHH